MLYSIFIPSPTGELVKASPAAGATGYAPAPLGNGYADAYRGQRAPSPVELVQQLVGTAYACADLNAGAVAANPFGLMVKTSPGKQARTRWMTRPVSVKAARRLKNSGQSATDGDVEEIIDPEHPLLALLAKPTQDPSGLGSFDLRYCTQLYLESLGRAYWWMPRDGLGVPREIWLLRSHMVREVPDYSGADLISHYQYGRQEIPADEVVRFHLPDPYSLYYGGYSPMLAAIEKIRIGRKEDAHIAALLDNMGRPDALLIPKGDSEGGGIGDVEARRWRAMVQAEFRRAGRGGLAVSEFPGSLEVLGWKPQDIVEIERAKAIKTDICNCFGVPDALLERNAANLAGAKTADYSHAKYAVNPRCVRLAEVLNDKLVRVFDPSGRLFLVFDNPVPDDEVFELEATKAGATTGIASVNEGRASLGLPPLDGPAGDMRYIAATSVPIGKDGMPISPKPPAPVGGATGDAGQPQADAGPQPSFEDQYPADGKKKDFDESKHPRAEHGQFGETGGSGSAPKDDNDSPAKGAGVAKRTPMETPAKASKSELAKRSCSIIDKSVQRYAEEHNEPQFAKAVGGLSYPDSEPVDVVTGKEGVITDGVELKTMVSNKASKLTMDRYAQVRKVEWEQKNKATFHTVVIDDRKVFNAGGEGQHDETQRTYFYRRGIAGSARIESMHECKNLAEVKKLMKAPEAKLPAGAQRTDAKIHEGKWMPIVDKGGKGYRNSKTGEVVRPKK